MGKLDTITKKYMSRPHYFADAFNSSVFKGKQIVKADELSLQEMDLTLVLNTKQQKSSFSIVHKNTFL